MDHEIFIKEHKYLYEDGKYFVRMTTLGPGSHFGELALINPDCKRMATMKCES